MSEQSRITGLLQIGTTALLTAAAVGGVVTWIQGDVHVTTNITSSGSLVVTENLKMTGDPGCIFLDGRAVDCYYEMALTSTGGTNSRHLIQLHNTGSALGFTGTASMLDFKIAATSPGETITFNCGFTTGSVLNAAATGLSHGTHVQLINAGAVSTGNQLYVDAYSKNTDDTSTGGLVWRKNTYLHCTSTTTIEKAAGAAGRATIHYSQY